MRMNPRNSARRSKTEMLIWFLAFCMIVCAVAGCKPRVVYLRGSEEITHILEGQPAPFEGWLMTPEKFCEIFDQAGEEDN